MLKRGFLFLLVMVFAVTLVSATFDATEEAIKSTIKPDEPAIFELTINNYGERDDTFRIASSDISWRIQSIPLYHYFSGITVPAKSSAKTTLMFYPPTDVRYGQYKIELDVKSVNTGVISKKFLLVFVRSPVPLIRDYFAAVKKIVDFDNRIDPRNKLTININLENKNPKNITNLVVELSSKVFQKQLKTTLAPWEEKTLQAEIILEPRTQPQDDTLLVTLYVDGQKLDPVLKEPFKILGYSEVKVDKKPVKKEFLKTTEEIIYYNDGNMVGKKVVERQTGIVEKIFMSASPKPSEIKKEGKSYLAWELMLNPDQHVTIRVVKSYRTLFGIIVAAIIIVILYYLLRSPVYIRKEAMILGLEEGGISELKVMLHLKNRSNRRFEKITLIDKIPHITKIQKEFESGTVKPTSIIQQKRGATIKWELDSLEKFEERIFSYRIKSKLSILGAFTLPKALLTFHTPAGIKLITRSNKVRVRQQ